MPVAQEVLEWFFYESVKGDKVDTVSPAPKRHPWRKAFRWSIVIFILAALVWSFRHFTRPDPLKVVVKPVTRGRVERTVANTRAGTVKACRRAKLSPSIGGQIARLPISEGDRVKEGELLLELWNEDLAAQVQFSRREITATRDRVRSACSRAAWRQKTPNAKKRFSSQGSVPGNAWKIPWPKPMPWRPSARPRAARCGSAKRN